MGKKHLAGYHIAITGTLSKVRADIIHDIEKAGGTFSKTVNNSTTHLVAANPYMSTTKVPDYLLAFSAGESYRFRKKPV